MGSETNESTILRPRWSRVVVTGLALACTVTVLAATALDWVATLHAVDFWAAFRVRIAFEATYSFGFILYLYHIVFGWRTRLERLRAISWVCLMLMLGSQSLVPLDNPFGLTIPAAWRCAWLVGLVVLLIFASRVVWLMRAEQRREGATISY